MYNVTISNQLPSQPPTEFVNNTGIHKAESDVIIFILHNICYVSTKTNHHIINSCSEPSMTRLNISIQLGTICIRSYKRRNVNYSRFSFQVDTQIRLGKRTSRVESVEAAAKDDSYYKETHLNFSFTATCWYGQMMSSYSYILSRSTISLVVLYLIEFYGVSFCPASHHQHIIILARRTSST